MDTMFGPWTNPLTKAFEKLKGYSTDTTGGTWTGALRKPEGYTPPKAATTVDGSASTLVSPKTLGVTTTTTPGYYGKSYTKTANGEVDDALLQDYAAKYGDEAKQAVLDYFNDKDTYLQNNRIRGLEDYMKNWYSSRQKATTKAPTETTTNAPASTSGVQQPTNAATNSQADALSNNVNDAENKAKSTMTVQSGSDMGGVNYTNAVGKSSTATTSSDDVMPTESATPTNQKYNSWISNASTFGTSDENEKTAPLTLSKTVYWARRKK